MKKFITLLFLSLFFALLLAACGGQATQAAIQPTAIPAGAVIAEGHIRPVQSVMLAFQGRGSVQEILVKQGDAVKQGDVLARLANSDQAQAAVVAAQQAYDSVLRNAGAERAKLWIAYMSAQKVRADALNKWNNLDVKDIESRMKDQQNVVDQRAADLANAQAEFDKYKNEPADNFYRQNASDKLQSAQENLDEAVRKLESITRERDSVRAALEAAIGAEAEAKYQYELTTDGPNKDELEIAKAQLDAAKETLRNFELTAPFDGTVASVNVNVGDQIGPEIPAIGVADFSQWIVETTDVTELEVVKLKIGQTATMVPDALPNVVITGKIDSISQSFVQQGGDIDYKVRITVDKVDPLIRWGMTVEATFMPGQ
jgi:HlyD family secretion protein